MRLYPVKFAPISQPRIWGGDQLKEWFGLEGEQPIGEYWVLSGHPSGVSVVINGDLAGKTLVELTELYPAAYLGRSPQPRFPLLIKFLEAQTDLSVQIHPDDEYAQKYEGDFGKTEAWYVLDCKEDGVVNYGHCFTSREQYMQAVEEGTVKRFLRYQPIQKEQLVFVPSRTLHALLAGTIVIEVQQTSDVTYRVYDWDRIDEKGNRRELHIEKAADALLYHEGDAMARPEKSSHTPDPTDGAEHTTMVACAYFTVERIDMKQGQYGLRLGKAGNPDILIVADGEGLLVYEEDGEQSLTLRRGDTVLVPSTLEQYALTTDTGLRILRTYY